MAYRTTTNLTQRSSLILLFFPLLKFRKIQKSIRGGTSGLLYTHVKFGWTPVDYSNYAAANTLANAFKAFALTSLYRGDGL